MAFLELPVLAGACVVEDDRDVDDAASRIRPARPRRDSGCAPTGEVGILVPSP
jgi:hypothetical protein